MAVHNPIPQTADSWSPNLANLPAAVISNPAPEIDTVICIKTMYYHALFMQVGSKLPRSRRFSLTALISGTSRYSFPSLAKPLCYAQVVTHDVAFVLPEIRSCGCGLHGTSRLTFDAVL
jgi:hypothetical protein